MSQSTNPKDKIGRTKPPIELIPGVALIETAMAFKNGARKYGPYNWRGESVSAMVYLGAMHRHLAAYQDRQDKDDESGASHLGHVMACAAIVLDAASVGKLVDDRPSAGKSAEVLKQNTAPANPAVLDSGAEVADVEIPGHSYFADRFRKRMIRLAGIPIKTVASGEPDTKPLERLVQIGEGLAAAVERLASLDPAQPTPPPKKPHEDDGYWADKGWSHGDVKRHGYWKIEDGSRVTDCFPDKDFPVTEVMHRAKVLGKKFAGKLTRIPESWLFPRHRTRVDVSAHQHTFPDRRQTADYTYLLSQGCHASVANQIVSSIVYGATPEPRDKPLYLYIAGPMRGLPAYNFPAFDQTRDGFTALGWNVISPADIDRHAGQPNPTATEAERNQAEYIYRDFFALRLIAYREGALAVLPGWEYSRGASAEFFLARWMGLRILRHPGGGQLTLEDIKGDELLGAVGSYLRS